MATASTSRPPTILDSLGTHRSTPIPGLTDGIGYGRGFWDNVRANYPHDLHEHLLRQQGNPATPHDERAVPQTLEELAVLQTEVGTWDPNSLNVSGAINLLTQGLIRVWANVQRLSGVPDTVKLDKLLETFEPAVVVAYQISRLTDPKKPEDKLVLKEPVASVHPDEEPEQDRPNCLDSDDSDDKERRELEEMYQLPATTPIDSEGGQPD